MSPLYIYVFTYNGKNLILYKLLFYISLYLFYISFIFLQFCAYQGQNNSTTSDDLYSKLDLLSESISQKVGFTSDSISTK